MRVCTPNLRDKDFLTVAKLSARMSRGGPSVCCVCRRGRPPCRSRPSSWACRRLRSASGWPPTGRSRCRCCRRSALAQKLPWWRSAGSEMPVLQEKERLAALERSYSSLSGGRSFSRSSSSALREVSASSLKPAPVPEAHCTLESEPN